MPIQHHINAERWPRCREVTLIDDILHCSLDFERAFVLVEKYQRDLHIEFANANTDERIKAFVRTWGPLSLSQRDRDAATASVPLGKVRAFQRWLRAVIGSLAAFKNAKGEREAMCELLQAEYGQEQYSPAPLPEPFSWGLLRAWLKVQGIEFTGTVADWLSSADIGSVRSATEMILSHVAAWPVAGEFVFRRRGNRGEVEARWAIDDLKDALRWMVWYDEFTRHPIICCQECRTVFHGETAHIRKYCSYECAHRATGREWQRRKRAALRSNRPSQRTRRK